MIHTSENNWYKWRYNNEEFDRKVNSSDQLITSYDFNAKPLKKFKDELLESARSTMECYPGMHPCIMFSGGLDSEVVLRSYLDIGVVPEIFIFRYENDINIYDVSYAITICNMLNLKYNIIDFNLDRFYKNDAERISEIAQIDRPRALPQLKFMEWCDGLPIYGASDLSICRMDADYSKKGSWIVRCHEHDIGWSKYAKYLNRPAIMEWFKWSPGVVASYASTEWCINLVSDRYYGKLGTNSTKLHGYREAYPDLLFRNKKTGFEELASPLIEEFEEYLRTKNAGLIYRNTCDIMFEDFYNMCSVLHK